MASEILSYASPDPTRRLNDIPLFYPALSIGTAVLPFLALIFRSMLLLFLGIPLTPLGFIAAITAIVTGRGWARALGVIGAIVSLPALYWYYLFLCVGIC